MDWLTFIVILAIIFVMVRPGSQGPALVTKIGTTLVGLVNAGTGGGGWSGKK